MSGIKKMDTGSAIAVPMPKSFIHMPTNPAISPAWIMVRKKDMTKDINAATHALKSKL